MNNYAVMLDGKQTPSRIYTSYEQAEYEAKRLAIKEKLTAYVLKVVSKVELVEVRVTHYEPITYNDEFPFH